ncbi:hypothetical protein PCANC_08557 [Puccinia coronata f. sp. avenae]|uniref:Uncharacterized protein n=1 Tax=Puccinia coronata f. sp. avenae TaxID=200324 RepID=A0A2N5V228_9BASI|nr:hypothetical protein PCANC_08557 [Puccinia coronata f. sp. avenae]
MHSIPVVERAILPSPANIASNAVLPPPSFSNLLGGKKNQFDERRNQRLVVDTYRPPQRAKWIFKDHPFAKKPVPKKPRVANPPEKQSRKHPAAPCSATRHTPLASGSRSRPGSQKSCSRPSSQTSRSRPSSQTSRSRPTSQTLRATTQIPTTPESG